MAETVVAEHRFEAAEEFLAALRPSHPLWKANPAWWLYRGHADLRWRLLPSGNRRSALGEYFATKYRGDGFYCEPDPLDLGALMVQFVHALDRAGYPVPSKFRIEKLAEKLTGGYPESQTDEVMALAQHYGLPTYMLDWTRHSTFAAYFAASETARLTTDLTGDIEVWALNRDVDSNRKGVMYGMLDDSAVRLFVSMPPRAGNQNLHAQGGAFTFSSYFTMHGKIRPADEIVEAMVGANIFTLPVMHRLKLPQREAGKLLRLLAFEPVTGGTMFPGIAGVVRDVRDRWHSRLDE
jgi:hypothetical protein